MENNQVKLHSMISSVASQETNAISVHDRILQKHNFGAIRTIKDAMKNGSSCLVTMKNTEPILAGNILKLMVAKTARAFNLTRNIEPAQIECLVEDLQTDYYYLKLSEIYFVLKEARMGRMGKTYERLDQPTIMKWFEDYAEQRLSIGEANYLSQHEQHTSSEKDRKYDGYISKLFTEQQSEQNKKVMNIAYGMAKKMSSSQYQQKIIIQPQSPPSQPNK